MPTTHDDQNDLDGSQPYATFVVELLLDAHRDIRRTQVAHVQSGARETWPGWKDNLLVNFMLAHVGARSRSIEPGLTLGERVPSGDQRAPLESTPWARLQQFPTAAESGSGEALGVQADRLTIDDVRPDRMVERPARARLRGQVRFAVVGTRASQVSARQTPYTLEILACELTSGKAVVLATYQERLRAGTPHYTPMVEFVLPDVGRYQLQALILLPDAEVVGVTLGPVVAVTHTAEGPDG